MRSWIPPIAPRKRLPWESLFRRIEFGFDQPPFKSVAFLRIVKFVGGMGRIMPGQAWEFAINSDIDLDGNKSKLIHTKTLRVRKDQDIQYLVAISVNGVETFFCPNSLRPIKDIMELLEEAAKREHKYKNQHWS